jgi:hypothetical protein
MKRFLAIWLICSGVCLGSVARADDCPVESKATSQSQCVVMRRGEVRGVFLGLPAMTALKQSVLDLADEREKTSKLAEALSLRDNEAKLLRGALDEQKASNAKLETALSEQTAQTAKKDAERQAAEDKANSPWRPVLYTAGGVAIGVAVSAAVYGVTQLVHH